MNPDDHSRYHDEELLTVADAARIAGRSVRTIRRAYLSGKLLAHRDGNGRGVSIRRGDLRSWLLAEVIAPRQKSGPPRLAGRGAPRKRIPRQAKTGNLELLVAAREHRSRRARVAKRV